LEEQGWQFLVVWECELKDTTAVVRTLRRFLGKAAR
jgi:G:T-mismatch repair DNA endonuclease (very short patch repair protein)